MAISPSSYAVGNRVYGGGSSAPTMGTVDPVGYVDRSLNAPSDSRSGLASAALRRLGGGAGNEQQSPSVPTGPLPDLNSLIDPTGGGLLPTVPSVRDAVKARMNPDGTYSIDVRNLQDQVATAHDYAQAAQRALMQMAPIPMPPEPPQEKAPKKDA